MFPLQIRKAGLIAALVLLAGAANAKPKYVTYEKFGAKGDGKTDDLEAIVAAHEWANEKGLPVKAKDGRTYYIGRAAKTAVIKTDTYWGKAKFIIDDTDVENIKTSVFQVASYQKPYDLKGLKGLRRGQTSIGMKLETICLLAVQDKGKMVYIRKGLNQNNGRPMREVIVVEKDGSISPNTPVIWNYARITSVKAYPVDETTLVILGGEFTTIANQAPSKYTYYARNIRVNRSNVRIEGLTHRVTGEGDHGAPYNAFLNVSEACNVLVKDCLMTGRKIYSTIGSAGKSVNMGSYDLGAQACASIRWENCTQTNDIDDRTLWGIFGSNYCKDLSMDHCILSRFDAHMGVTGVHLKDCIFGHQGVRMVGFNTLRIENCEIRFPILASLRADYGSSWEGDIVVRNCVLKVPARSKGVLLFNGSNDGHHDFGYTCHLPSRIEIDGLVIDDSARMDKSYKHPYIFGSFNRNLDETDLLPYPAEGTVVLRNISVKSGKTLKACPNPKLIADYQIEGL